jgi:ABC-2 type transport system permease protein
MRTTFRIAKLELNTLFYSPIAWFLLIVFLFQCGLSYTGTLSRLLTEQNIGGNNLRWLFYSTSQVFGYQGGLFYAVLGKIFLYIPLLTMGLISREVNSGTIKLLYSSPVKIREIVLGKFTAMMVYNLLLVLILVGFAMLGAVNIRHADIGFIFSGILAIYLLLSAYAAIGLFMSSLTSYQVVAAISTLVAFAALAYVGSLWQDIDFVRGLTYFLSISGRAERMIYGLVSTKHVMYFVIITGMFLSFTVIKLNAARETKSGMQVTMRYIFVLALALVCGYVTSIPGFTGYYDATTNHTQTLTPATQKIVKELGDEPLVVTSYINLVSARYRIGQPQERNRDLERWEPYLRFKSNITFKYVYYYDQPSAKEELMQQYPGKTLKQIAAQIAYSYKTDLDHFKTPEEIRKIIDLEPENNSYVMQLQYKGKTTFLRLFDDNEVYPSETEVGAAFKRLIATPPSIVFATGEFERSKEKTGDKNYGVLVALKTARFALINQGFDVDTVSLQQQDVPANATALVIADPRLTFSPQALTRIQKYIDGGGNLLVAGEPGKQALLSPILQPLGVQLMDGMLVQKSKDNTPDAVIALMTPFVTAWNKDLKSAAKEGFGVSMPSVTGLIYSNDGPFAVQPLLMTDPKTTWHRNALTISDSTELVYNPANGDDNKSVPTALALTRNVNGKQQRIIVTSDADFLSSAELNRYTNANGSFDTPLVGWVTGGQFPIDTSRPEAPDNWINLDYSQFSFLKTMLLGIIPALLAIAAAIFLIRRKRK